MKTAIIGMGIIGHAIGKLFSEAIEIDIYASSRIKMKITSDVIAFICVPTPYDPNSKKLNTDIIEDVVAEYNPKLFVICSTLQPGTADRLMTKYKKRIVVHPEYFGETIGHPLTNLSQQPFLILGGNNEDIKPVIDLYKTIYSANIKIRKVTALEAEVIKLSENRAIAYKVAQCQELYDACKSHDVDYDIIREAVYGDDPRFNLWWTFIFEDHRGFNSKCIPKDVYGWLSWAKEKGFNPEITKALLKYNDELIKKGN